MSSLINTASRDTAETSSKCFSTAEGHTKIRQVVHCHCLSNDPGTSLDFFFLFVSLQIHKATSDRGQDSFYNSILQLGSIMQKKKKVKKFQVLSKRGKTHLHRTPEIVKKVDALVLGAVRW